MREGGERGGEDEPYERDICRPSIVGDGFDRLEMRGVAWVMGT